MQFVEKCVGNGQERDKYKIFRDKLPSFVLNVGSKVGHVYITIDLLSEQFRRVIQNCVCRHVIE